MPIAIAVFAVVLAIVVGAYWLLIVRPESGERESIQKRLRQPRKIRLLAKLEKDPEKLSAVGSVDTLLTQLEGFSTPLQRMILQSGLQLTVGALVLGSIALGFATAAVGSFLLPSVIAAIVLGLLASMLPFMVVKRKATKRLLAFEEQFPEAIDLIARALRAGHALPTALQMVADEIPEPVGTEFKQMFEQHSYGMALTETLRAFGDRVQLLDARFFVTAVLTQREMGGNLSEVLDNLATVIRDRFKVKRQVRVLTAHGRITGWILSALPPSLAIMISFVSPDHMKTMFTDPLGIQMLAVAGTMQVVGALIIRKLVNVPY